MRPLPHLVYRIRQFRLAFFDRYTPVPVELLSPHISPALILLFQRMTPSEQAHSFAVLRRLLAAGQADPDLLATALLHDVGKACSPLSVWDRSLIVLGKYFFPRLAERWGNGELHSFRRSFVVSARHPAWGADLASAAGASPRTCDLIRRHQERTPGNDALLTALRLADDLE